MDTCWNVSRQKNGSNILTAAPGALPAGGTTPDPQAANSQPSGSLGQVHKSVLNNLNAVLKYVTEQFIADFIKMGLPMDIETIRAGLLADTANLIDDLNVTLPKSRRMRAPQTLQSYQIAELILAFHHVRNIECSGDGQNPVLGLYMTDGAAKGTYQTDEKIIRRLIHKYNNTISQSDLKLTIQFLEEKAPMLPRCSNPNLIPVNNGIFDYLNRKLLPFTPEHIFLTKTPIDYIPNPGNPVIVSPAGEKWDVESWFESLSDDPEVVRLLWQAIGAAIRPGVDWGAALLPFCPTGCNGKSSWISLARNLCGQSNVANISIPDFGVRFQLEPIIGASLICYDENPAHIYLDDSTALKALITHDTIGIDRKNRSRVSFTFNGLIIEGTNSLPRIHDTTSSLLRRLLFIPFDKCFLGRARPEIKNDYLKRPEVLQYVLWKVLTMPAYYKFDEPLVCSNLRAQYAEFNDNVRAFFNEFKNEFRWNFLPFDFLYDLYLAWNRRNNPSGKSLSKSSFRNEMRQIAQNDPDWMVYKTKNGDEGWCRLKPYITQGEPLINEYYLTKWSNLAITTYVYAPPPHSGNSIVQMNFYGLKDSYPGLIRKNLQQAGAVPVAPND